MPSAHVRHLRHLLQSRETLVGMATKLKNMGQAALTCNGLALSRAAFASAGSRARLEARPDLARIDQTIMAAALRQLAALEAEVAELEAEVVRAGKAICATAGKLLTVIWEMLRKGLDYWYLEYRLNNRKLRALEAAA